MKRPTPAALEYAAMVMPIWPKAYRERVGPEGFSRAPIGTGPYRLTKVDVSAGVEYERFDDYYQGGPKGKPEIQKLTARYIGDAATELTELLGQRVDWIWNMNPDQMANVNRLPYLQATQQESMRVAFLNLDAAGRGGAGHSVNDIIQALERLLGRAVERRVFPARPFDPPVNVLDIQRAQEELQWAPTMAFEEGVAMSVQWLRTVL